MTIINSIKTINYAIHPLQQFKILLKFIKNDDYSIKHSMFFDSSIGSHVRHSFDHYNTVLENYGDKTLFTYDKRKRETIIETDINAGLNECENIIKQLSSQNILNNINSGIYQYYNII
jgi:hypothetical protein